MNILIRAPMLAPRESLDLDTFTGYPVYISPKLDGIRCLIVDGKAVTRTLKPIPNHYIRTTLESLNLPHGFDGEILTYTTKDKWDDYNTVQSKVMTKLGIPSFIYNVFDWIGIAIHYAQRQEYLSVRFRVNLINCIIKVPSLLCSSKEQVEDCEQAYLSKGYEGIMINSPSGYYIQCPGSRRVSLKDNTIWKLKRFEDSEGLIVGAKPAYANLSAQEISETGRTYRPKRISEREAKNELGAFTCTDPNHPEYGEFDVGIGYKQWEREKYWDEYNAGVYTAKKTYIKYKYFKQRTKDKPSSPVFLGFRSPQDM